MISVLSEPKKMFFVVNEDNQALQKRGNKSPLFMTCWKEPKLPSH
jgi:hypothetical protein